MNTDQMVQDDIKEAMSFENAPKIPAVKPAPRVKRPSGIFSRLRGKQRKVQGFGEAIRWAHSMIGYTKTTKILQQSLMAKFNISAHVARAAVRAAKAEKKKRRVRS